MQKSGAISGDLPKGPKHCSLSLLCNVLLLGLLSPKCSGTKEGGHVSLDRGPNKQKPYLHIGGGSAGLPHTEGDKVSL